MPTEIKIKWEGSAPGLAEKRLSISAFGEALNALLAALRRIATNMVGDAVGDAVEDKNVGRFSSAARQLDIEITDLIKESSGFDGVVTLTTPPGANLDLFANLPERAAAELLDAIDFERRGQPRNAGARKYLRTLPSGIIRQSYWLHDNGNILKEITFGDVDIHDVPPDPPYISKYVGKIVGVGFEPGKSEVRIQSSGARHTLSATAEQVEKALELRAMDVAVTAVITGSLERLLILRDAKTMPVLPARDTAIYARWSDLLQRLAR